MNINILTGWVNSFVSMLQTAFNTLISFVTDYKDKVIIVVLLIAGGWAMSKGSKMFSINSKLNVGKK
jgi:hypothetical protein